MMALPWRVTSATWLGDVDRARARVEQELPHFGYSASSHNRAHLIDVRVDLRPHRDIWCVRGAGQEGVQFGGAAAVKNVPERVALVTGFNCGLGFALASGLASRGLAVVVAGRDAAAAEQAGAALRADGAGEDASGS